MSIEGRWLSDGMQSAGACLVLGRCHSNRNVVLSHPVFLGMVFDSNPIYLKKENCVEPNPLQFPLVLS